MFHYFNLFLTAVIKDFTKTVIGGRHCIKVINWFACHWVKKLFDPQNVTCYGRVVRRYLQLVTRFCTQSLGDVAKKVYLKKCSYFLVLLLLPAAVFCKPLVKCIMLFYYVHSNLGEGVGVEVGLFSIDSSDPPIFSGPLLAEQYPVEMRHNLNSLWLQA